MTVAPLVSVVIPTRNRADILPRTLAAVARQTLTDIEVIVYDDGSTAETRATYASLAERFGSRIRFVTETPAGAPGQGPSTARNRAIAVSRAELIAFCDDDDEWTADDHLAVAAAALRECSDADVFYADQVAVVDGAVQASTWWPELAVARMHQRPVAGTELCFPTPAQMLQVGSFAHLNLTVARRATIDAIGGFWRHGYYEEDLDFYWRMLDKSRGLIFRPKVVARHHVPNKTRQDNASTRLDRSEQLLARIGVCLHARSRVNSPDVLAAIRRAEGYAYRHLAVLYRENGRHAVALTTAAAAFAAMPSLKWGVFLTWLGLRRIGSGKHGS